VKVLKKILVLVLLAILFLSACNSSQLSFSEIENVPDHIQHKVDFNLKLQSITDGGSSYYIVFHSSGDVETNLETLGDTVTINFNETNPQEEGVKQNTFYLTTDRRHDVIEVFVNDKSMAFDSITVY